MPTIAAEPLIGFSIELLVSGGVPWDEAEIVARSLVGANLRGHDSHGVMRIPYYLDGVAKREVIPGAELTDIRETDSILMVDGHWGLGQVQATRLTRRLIDKARQQAVVVGTMIQSTHIGRLGEYCELAAEAGLISMVMVNTHGTARRVAPVGGTAPRLGTNPLAIGVPDQAGPLILDFGTSATAEGKVRVKRIAGETCPEGWLLDSTGQPTTDPNTLYGNPPGTIRPMGGDQAYKGFGLALMVEILSGALSGGVCAREAPKNQLGNCVFMQLFDPRQFCGGEFFAAEVNCLSTFVRSCPTVDAAHEVLLPGDPERRTLRARSEHGIPLDAGNWGQLTELAARLRVVTPAVNS